MRPTVVVVGGGYGGVTAAKALDEVADVVLVERKEAFVNNIGALRAAVDPGFLPRIFVPYDRLLRNGTVVRGRATRVDAKHVTLGSGTRIDADYIVLATGSRYPFPAKSDADETATALRRYREIHAALEGARRVLLLGAGPVGLELAGEITSAWPAKAVTIVDPATQILTGDFDPELRARLQAQLADRGVRLILGTTLDREPPNPPGTAGTFTATTVNSTQVVADVWLRCYGVRPVTDYLDEDLAVARTPAGTLRVGEDLRLSGHDRVFALGDISNVAEPKMAARAQRQAEVAAANIRADITGDGAVTLYRPDPPVILVPLGSTGGASQLPGTDEIAGPETTAQYKGHDLFTDHFAQLLGQPAAG